MFKCFWKLQDLKKNKRMYNVQVNQEKPLNYI